MRLGVVGKVPLHGVGFLLGVAHPAGHLRDLVDQGGQLADVVDVGRRYTEANGMPLASVITWCLLPGLARSTGLGPVSSPP